MEKKNHNNHNNNTNNTKAAQLDAVDEDPGTFFITIVKVVNFLVKF